MEKVVKRGYVKWTDEDGQFHKEPLYDHPELLAKASPEEQLAAEEARRLNAAAEERIEEASEDTHVEETLEALKKAPEEVLTAAQIVEDAPASAAVEPDEKHEEALRELREKTVE